MFYKFKLRIYKSHLLRKVVRSFRKMKGPGTGTDLNTELIRKYVNNKSFADIGCMWRVDGLYSFLAEEFGAKRVVAVDIYPTSEKFLFEKNKRNSIVEFVQGDIHQKETADKIGLCDVVFCSGVLYHSPDPFFLISRLRSICGSILIFQTQTIPEMTGIKNVAVFYPFLNERQRKIWDQGVGMQKGITGSYEPESGYGNWFWGLTPSCVESMLRCNGFKVIERYIRPFNGYFVCQTEDVKFLPVSGEWITPEDQSFLRYKK